MAEAKKFDTFDSHLSKDFGDSGETTIDDIRKRYPEFSRLLIQRMNEIVPRQSSARSHLDEQVLGSPGDDADVSTAEASADYFLKLANAHQQELGEIREALDRIRRGEYGECAHCEEPIAMERLKKLPTARLCVDCQALREKKISTFSPKVKSA